MSILQLYKAFLLVRQLSKEPGFTWSPDHKRLVADDASWAAALAVSSYL